MSHSSSSSVRIGELDALRGLAALAVVAYHYSTHYARLDGHVDPLPFGFPAGNYGVHVFFLISGFVIFMTLERTRSAMDFVVSRFSRLFPAYWAAILLSAAVVYSIGLPGQHLPLGQLLLNFTMLQQILGAEHLDGSYWTLEVELFFYVQMLIWFMLGQLGRIRWIIGAWLVLVWIQGIADHNHMHFSHTARELLILRYVPFFALGILFYRFKTRPEGRRIDLCLMLAALAAIGFAYEPVFLLVAVVCCALFGLFVLGALRWLAHPALALLGTISYSLYLLHQAIGFALIYRLEHHGVPSLVAISITLLCVLGLAIGLTFLIERPALRLIRDWWRQRRPSAGKGATVSG